MVVATRHIDERFLIELFRPAYLSLPPEDLAERVRAGLEELEDRRACPRNW